MWVHTEHGTPDAGMFMFAGSTVGPFAGTQCHLTKTEVVPEIVPFGIGWLTVFLGRAHFSPLFDIVAVMVDAVLRIDRDVPLSGIQIEVP